ncbi:MAG TPA: hypothetical protein PLN69_01690 [bacterium]|nr:hypothetical protein [bacterium]
MVTFIVIVVWARLILIAAALSTTFLSNNKSRNTLIILLIAALSAANIALLAAMSLLGTDFPLKHNYDSFCSYILTIGLILIFSLRSFKTRLPVILILTLMLIYSASGIHGLALEPSFSIHKRLAWACLFVMFRDFAVACFAVSACLSLCELVSPGKHLDTGGTSSGPVYMPVLWGFFLFSLAQVVGSIWTVSGGWGDVWLWKRSFLFSAVVWIYYAGMMHVKHVPGWTRKLFPALAITGYVIQLFYLHIYYYLTSTH